MTDDRAHRAVQLCGQLSREVAQIAPPGIGRWSPAWQIVAEADAEFVVALAAWERSGSEGEQSRLRESYLDVLGAWKCAAAAFLEQRVV